MSRRTFNTCDGDRRDLLKNLEVTKISYTSCHFKYITQKESRK